MLFDGQPRAIEAAAKALANTPAYDYSQTDKRDAARVLTAAVAALDRDALVEKVLISRYGYVPPASDDRITAILHDFAAIGLIPEAP